MTRKVTINNYYENDKQYKERSERQANNGSEKVKKRGRHTCLLKQNWLDPSCGSEAVQVSFSCTYL